MVGLCSRHSFHSFRVLANGKQWVLHADFFVLRYPDWNVIGGALRQEYAESRSSSSGCTLFTEHSLGPGPKTEGIHRNSIMKGFMTASRLLLLCS